MGTPAQQGCEQEEGWTRRWPVWGLHGKEPSVSLGRGGTGSRGWTGQHRRAGHRPRLWLDVGELELGGQGPCHMHELRSRMEEGRRASRVGEGDVCT